MPDFVHLHVHTQYSLLDGAIKIKDLVKRVKELGMTTVAMTDHGNMYGAVDFQKTAKKAGVKPIVGCELYVTKEPYDLEEKTDPRSYHLTALATNLTGYKNLMFLNSMAWLDGVHPRSGVPRIDFDLIASRHEGIVFMSGDLGGEINQAILMGDTDMAYEIATRYRDAIPDGYYYLEVMDNGFPEQRRCNEVLFEMSDRLGIPLVATNDCHYMHREDATAQAVLMAIQLGKTVDLERLMEHGVDQLYVRSPEEMYAAFPQSPEACANTVRIAEMCDLEIPLGQVFLPKYGVPEEFKVEHGLEDLDEAIHAYFAHVAQDGLEMRFREFERKSLPYDRAEYQARLDEEVGIIQGMDFPGYFLIVWDFIAWAKEQGIPVGPGRGSGAGSLVAYSMEITDIDPLPYELLFERFLNPERVSMPDFDIDFCMNRRGEVIQYVTEKYGHHNVGQIITYGQLKAKAVVRDVGRALGLTYGETDRLAKMVPDVLGITLQEALDQEPRLGQMRQEDPRVHALFDIALSLENLNRQAGMHAAGVVISETPLWDFVPICRGANDELVTQFAKNEVEEAGLVKFDFLGLKTLTVLDTAIKLIDAQRDEPFDLATIPMDDRPVFKMISAGDTTGVFQLESSGFQELLKKLKPDCFEDIIAAVALYRPGPLGTGMVDDFIDRKHGRKKVEYPHPWLADTLKPTYGVMVYQEQVMKTAQVMAGYSLGGADILRRCVTGDALVTRADTGERVRVDAVEPGTPLLTMTPDLRFDHVEVQERIDNGEREVFEVRTRSGRRIQLTHDHPLYTVMGWRHLSDLDIGDSIAVPMRLPVDASRSVPRERARALGYLLGDGQTKHRSGRALARFYNSDGWVVDDYVECARALGGLVRSSEDAQTGVCVVWSRRDASGRDALVELVEETGCSARAEDKSVPSEVFGYGDGSLVEFLGALWTCDGSIEAKRISYSSSSERLIDDVSHLLLRLGIVSMRRSRATSRLDNHELLITDMRDVVRFSEVLGAKICPVKRARARALALAASARSRNQSVYNIPQEVGHLVRDAKRASGLSWRQAGERAGLSGNTLSAGLNLQEPARALSRHRVEALALGFGSDALTALAHGDVLWDPVVSVRSVGLERVYDLCVPPHANFVVNDVVIHNSMGKKKKEVMDEQKEVFVEGALGLGVDQETSGGIFDLMAFFAGYGFNKCVVGSTVISDADTGARRTVRELFDDREPMRVHALGEDGKLRPRDVLDVMWNGVKPVYALETAQGKRIVATGNHPFKTLGGWTNLEDLEVGDRVAAPRTLAVDATHSWPDEHVVTLAWLLSEGNTCHPTCLYFYNNVEESIDDFAQAASVFEDTVARITTRDGGRMEVCLSTGRDTRFAPGHVPWNASSSAAVDVADAEPQRSGAYRWAEELGLLGLKAHEKRVPEEVFTLSDSQIELFLGRIWAGDGFFANATQAVPFYATSSVGLARDVQHLLSRLGILSGVHSKVFKYRGGEREGYTVHLFGDGSREAFLDRVAPHAVGRQDAVELLSTHLDASPGISFKDTIPVGIRERVRELKGASDETWGQLEASAGLSMKDFTGSRVSPKKKGFRRDSVARLAEHFDDDVLRAEATSDVFWDEIVSIEYLGEEDTYDLTVDVDHNFVADGLIVHNSHSAAYALITYQTAFLKKHYEVEFMAALMTNDRDNTDKVVRFINEAKSMGIEVLPPDVNKSQLDFSVVDGQIRFGMAGIKGVGAGVIETLLEARASGPFKSLYDFCARVDSKKINKRTIEALVKSGAFDAIGPKAGSRYIGDHCESRASMFEAIPLALERGKKMQQDKEVGQSSLFGMLSAPAREEALEENYPDASPWPDKELLGYERHLIGFYVTGHPLDRFDDEIAIYGVSSTADVHYCKGFQYRDEVTVAGVISEYRERPLKSGNGRMAFLTLEDKTGQCEVLVFSAAFAENEEALKSGEPILIRGQYTEDGDLDGRVGKVRAAEVVRLLDARKKFVRKIRVELDEADVTDGQIGKLRDVFAAHPGGCSTRLTIKIPHALGAGLAELALPESYNVDPTDELLTEIERLFRRKVVRLSS